MVYFRYNAYDSFPQFPATQIITGSLHALLTYPAFQQLLVLLVTSLRLSL